MGTVRLAVQFAMQLQFDTSANAIVISAVQSPNCIVKKNIESHTTLVVLPGHYTQQNRQSKP
jgi:hypothetical protein